MRIQITEIIHLLKFDDEKNLIIEENNIKKFDLIFDSVL